jgi:hypothetical protein
MASKSKYIRLMEEYKLARKKGDEKSANKLFMAARKLLKEGKVTEDEQMAAAYL